MDFTFKGVEGDMDEWEVAHFLDLLTHRLTFTSLYCGKKTRPAFCQLFTELFDGIHQVTGEPFNLAPFFPDAKYCAVIMDGEVLQVQGLGDFLATHNDPAISGRYTLKWDKLILYSLKTCNPHFQRPVIFRLKSIMGLGTQGEIVSWHELCAAETEPSIKNWYPHKLANPWILPSINKFLFKNTPADWDVTQNHSNYVETAHTGRNSETSVGLRLLAAILQAQERDNIKSLFRHLRHSPQLDDEPKTLAEKITNESDVLKKM
ncbi:hypothetical protein C8J57DRAFT_1251734 [Mycena rebaudengoi]|nr:hypothetical protein C8J57DRAFT_1251734 [Mycena rebaudengoi]